MAWADDFITGMKIGDQIADNLLAGRKRQQEQADLLSKLTLENEFKQKNQLIENLAKSESTRQEAIKKGMILKQLNPNLANMTDEQAGTLASENGLLSVFNTQEKEKKDQAKLQAEYDYFIAQNPEFKDAPPDLIKDLVKKKDDKNNFIFQSDYTQKQKKEFDDYSTNNNKTEAKYRQDIKPVKPAKGGGGNKTPKDKNSKNTPNNTVDNQDPAQTQNNDAFNSIMSILNQREAKVKKLAGKEK